MVELTILGVAAIVAGACLGSFWLSFKIFLALYFPVAAAQGQEIPSQVANLEETFYGDGEPVAERDPKRGLSIYARQYLEPDPEEDEGIKIVRQELRKAHGL